MKISTVHSLCSYCTVLQNTCAAIGGGYRWLGTGLVVWVGIWVVKGQEKGQQCNSVFDYSCNMQVQCENMYTINVSNY